MAISPLGISPLDPYSQGKNKGITSFADNYNPGYQTAHSMQGRTALYEGQDVNKVNAAQAKKVASTSANSRAAGTPSTYANNTLPDATSDGSFDYGSVGVTTSEDVANAANKVKDQVLSQEDFLKLLTAQLQAQDPTKPADNNQLVTQMSQLSMVESLNTINDNMANVVGSVTASSALNATNLIGSYVYTDTNQGLFDGGNIVSWAIDAGQEFYKDVKLTVKDAQTGEVVYTDEAGSLTGEIKFAWQGVLSPDGPVEGGEGGIGGGDGEGTGEGGEVTDPGTGESKLAREGESGGEGGTGEGDGEGGTGEGGDGEKPEVTLVPPGRYILEVTGVNDAGQTVALPTKSLALVSSVTLGKTMDDTMLTLYGYGEMPFSKANRVTL